MQHYFAKANRPSTMAGPSPAASSHPSSPVLHMTQQSASSAVAPAFLATPIGRSSNMFAASKSTFITPVISPAIIGVSGKSSDAFSPALRRVSPTSVASPFEGGIVGDPHPPGGIGGIRLNYDRHYASSEMAFESVNRVSTQRALMVCYPCESGSEIDDTDVVSSPSAAASAVSSPPHSSGSVSYLKLCSSRLGFSNEFSNGHNFTTSPAPQTQNPKDNPERLAEVETEMCRYYEPGDPNNTMLRVKIITTSSNGGNKVFDVSVNSTATIIELMNQLSSTSGMENFLSSELLLLFNDKLLERNKNLSYYNITDSSVLYLMENQRLQLFIRTYDRTITLDVTRTTSISEVKDQIFEKTGTSKEDQRLLYGAKELHDLRTIVEYHVPKESTLFLHQGRLIGGSRSKNAVGALGRNSSTKKQLNMHAFYRVADTPLQCYKCWRKGFRCIKKFPLYQTILHHSGILRGCPAVNLPQGKGYCKKCEERHVMWVQPERIPTLAPHCKRPNCCYERFTFMDVTQDLCQEHYWESRVR